MGVSVTARRAMATASRRGRGSNKAVIINAACNGKEGLGGRARKHMSPIAAGARHRPHGMVARELSQDLQLARKTKVAAFLLSRKKHKEVDHLPQAGGERNRYDRGSRRRECYLGG